MIQPKKKKISLPPAGSLIYIKNSNGNSVFVLYSVITEPQNFLGGDTRMYKNEIGLLTVVSYCRDYEGSTIIEVLTPQGVGFSFLRDISCSTII